MRPREEIFLEKMGAFFEAVGLDRTSGRILGLLFLKSPKEQSTSDIMSMLNMSRGAVSMATRSLVKRGYAEVRGVQGSRKKLFRARQDAWTIGIAERARDFGMFASIAAYGVENVGNLSREGKAKLEEIRDFYLFLEKRFPTLIDEWQVKRESDNAT